MSESSLPCCILCRPWAIKPFEEGALQMVLSTTASHKWDLDQKWSSVQSCAVVLQPLSCAPVGRLMNRWENVQGFCIGKTVKILLSKWSSACLSPPPAFFLVTKIIVIFTIRINLTGSTLGTETPPKTLGMWWYSGFCRNLQWKN